MRSEVVTYMHWVERLPEAVLQNQPRLIVYQTWGLLFAGYSKEKIESYMSGLGNQAEFPFDRATARLYCSFSRRYPSFD